MVYFLGHLFLHYNIILINVFILHIFIPYKYVLIYLFIIIIIIMVFPFYLDKKFYQNSF